MNNNATSSKENETKSNDENENKKEKKTDNDSNKEKQHHHHHHKPPHRLEQTKSSGHDFNSSDTKEWNVYGNGCFRVFSKHPTNGKWLFNTLWMGSRIYNNNGAFGHYSSTKTGSNMYQWKFVPPGTGAGTSSDNWSW
eukprot:146998_1